MANEVIISIRAKDEATGVLKNVKRSLQDISSTNVGNDAVGGLDQAFGKFATTLGIVAAAAATAAAAIRGATEFVKEGAAIDRLREASGTLASSMGLDMDEIVSAVRDASLNTVSDMDIMQSSARALMFGVGASAEQLAKLMETAALRGRAMGLSAQQAFDDIVRGIGRSSPKILDNLGIVLNITKVYEDYAKSLGKTRDQLTEFEEKQALVNAVIADTAAYMKETGGLVEDDAAKWEQMAAAGKNLGDALKLLASDKLSWVAEGLTKVTNGLIESIDKTVLYDQLLGTLEEQLKSGVITEEEWIETISKFNSEAGTNAELIAMMSAYVEDWDNSVNSASGESDTFNRYLEIEKQLMGELPGAIEGAGSSLSHFGLVSEQVAEQVDNFLEKAGLFAADFGEMFSIGENFSKIAGLAKNLTSEMRDLEEVNGRILQLNDVYAKGGGYFEGEYWSVKKLTDELSNLNGKAVDIQLKMDQMGNQLTLDMLENAMMIDGIMSEEEFTAYMDLSVELGEIDRAPADAAIAQFSESLEMVTAVLEVTFDYDAAQVDEYVPPKKASEVTYTPESSAVSAWQPPTKYGNVIYTPQYTGFGQPDHPASGMAVFTGTGKAAGGGIYTVGEIGPEPFFPATNGRILSNSEAKSQLRSAWSQGGGETVNVIINTPINLADRVWVERELEPYIRKALRQAR
jgi:hypothetical protein